MSKNNKASGPVGVSGEILKHDGYFLLCRLHRFITAAWTSGKILQRWKDADIGTMYKRKGDKAVCGR